MGLRRWCIIGVSMRGIAVGGRVIVITLGMVVLWDVR